MTLLAIALFVVIVSLVDHPARFGSWLHFVKRGYDAGSDRERVNMEDEKYRDATKGLSGWTYLFIVAVILAIVAVVITVV